MAFLFTGAINVLMLASPLYTLQMFETVVPTSSLETLAALTAMACVAILVMMLLEIVRDRILSKAGLWLDFNLGGFILERWLRLGPAHGADARTEARLVAAVRAYSAGPAMHPLFDAPWIPIFLVALFLMHPLLGFVGIVSAGLLAACALLHAAVSEGPQGETASSQEATERWFKSLAQEPGAAAGAGLASVARERWEALAEDGAEHAYRLANRTNAVKALARSLRLLSQIAIFAAGAFVIIRHEATPGVLIASSIIMGRALAPLEQATSLLKLYFTAVAASRRLKSLPAARADAGETFAMDASETPAGRITLSDVSYAYPGRTTLALRGVSLELEKAESLGIIGPNGSGKSTLAAILAGALEPRSGSAALDGVAIGRWQLAGEAPLIGYAGARPLLFDGSVHENIVRFSDASLMSSAHAAMRAGVHDVLTELPQGYETRIGHDGTSLAPREARAVALARAVHGPTRIVVLDEPEAGLDGAGEKKLLRTLAELKKEGVRIVIATQQPRLLSLVDKVAVLQKGAIELYGPSAEVARKLNGGGSGKPARNAAAPKGARGTSQAVS
jgi:ATP-binding cassette subfamily C protein